MTDLELYLEDLESRIDPAEEDALHRQWISFTDSAERAGPFSPARSKTGTSKIVWPSVPVNDAVEDFDRMVLQQFGLCSRALEEGGGRLLCVRANYGTGILPSLFGAELFMMERGLDTLPTVRPLAGGIEAVGALIDAGVPDPDGALGGRVLEMGRRFKTIKETYPRIGTHVHVFHPDLQGPIDVCELLLGSDLFLALVDRPDLVHALLDLITDTYIRFMNAWNTIFPPTDAYAVHWSMMHGGRIMIRDDSAMNLSPRMFETFIRPYDQRLLDTLGGGAIHFCGRGNHFIERVSEMRGVHAVHLSQPEWNDLDTMCAHTIAKDIKLIGLPLDTAGRISEAWDAYSHHVHCWRDDRGIASQ